MLPGVGDVLTGKELNRATLARQMLLAREKTPVLRAVERLAGLQSQLARPPYIGLWSRVQGFRPEQLTKLARERKVVRATLMRSTLHLVSTKDYQALRQTLQPMLTAAMRAVLKERAKGIDVDRLKATARACLDERPQPFETLRAELARCYPDVDARALGYAVRTNLPLVQVPADTRWGWPGTADFAVAESWIGRAVSAKPDPAALVRWYLGALGPATVRDAMAWSGMRELEEAFAALRPKLRVFHDEKGRELFDLTQAPRPPARTPAPPRFLPDYDNLLLGHADRTRMISDDHRRRVVTKNLQILPTFLVDGTVAGTWRIERARASAALVLQRFVDVTRTARAALVEEGKALLAFCEPDARTTDIRLE
jgi:winged helix DNA-binding protein